MKKYLMFPVCFVRAMCNQLAFIQPVGIPERCRQDFIRDNARLEDKRLRVGLKFLV